MQYDISMIVMTFNPDYDKLFQTLYSLIGQKDIRMQIVVTDDGSDNFSKEKVENWFAKKNFTEYTIICNLENRGIVWNVCSALEEVKGKYIKCISPGDYLYNETTLKKLFDYMEKKNSKVCFGKSVFYNVEDDNLKCNVVNKSNPRNTKPYMDEVQTRLKKNYLLYKDFIVGASLCFETSLVKKYMKKLCSRVIYTEDSVVFLYIADDIRVDFYDDYIIWYEFGVGISTCKNAEWAEKLKSDIKNAYTILKEEHPEYSYIYDALYGKLSLKALEGKVVRFLSNKLADWKQVHTKPNMAGIDMNKFYQIKSGNMTGE